MNVITDTLRGLVQRKLWPVAAAARRRSGGRAAAAGQGAEAPDRHRAARREGGGPARHLRVRRRGRRGHRAPPRARRREGPVRAGRAVEEGQGRAQEGQPRRPQGRADKGESDAAPRAAAAPPPAAGRRPRAARERGAGPGQDAIRCTRSRSASARSTDELKSQDGRAPDGAAVGRGAPVLVYRGVEEGGKVAVFELTGSVIALGDGELRPDPGGLPDPQAARRRDRVHHRDRHGHGDRRPVPAGAREDLHEDDDVASRARPRPRRRSSSTKRPEAQLRAAPKLLTHLRREPMKRTAGPRARRRSVKRRANRIFAVPLKVVTAGESHGPGLTTIVEGLPAGLELRPGGDRRRHGPAPARARPRRADEDREGHRAGHGRRPPRADARRSGRAPGRQPRLQELGRADEPVAGRGRRARGAPAAARPRGPGGRAEVRLHRRPQRARARVGARDRGARGRRRAGQDVPARAGRRRWSRT